MKMNDEKIKEWSLSIVEAEKRREAVKIIAKKLLRLRYFERQAKLIRHDVSEIAKPHHVQINWEKYRCKNLK